MANSTVQVVWYSYVMDLVNKAMLKTISGCCIIFNIVLMQLQLTYFCMHLWSCRWKISSSTALAWRVGEEQCMTPSGDFKRRRKKHAAIPLNDLTGPIDSFNSGLMIFRVFSWWCKHRHNKDLWNCSWIRHSLCLRSSNRYVTRFLEYDPSEEEPHPIFG